MADFPGFRWPPLNVITPWSWESLQASRPITLLALQSSTAFATNNLVRYYPFRMYEEGTAVKMSYIVGGVANGNVDLGIYDSQKNRLVNSGSTAQGSINTLQVLDITDTVLPRGDYWMAIAASSSTGTGVADLAPQADEIAIPTMIGYTETPGAFGLPATAAFAPTSAATVLMYGMGVHFSTLV